MRRREFVRAAGTVALTGALAGCSGSADEITFEVEYDGAWAGALAYGGESKSIEGDGSETFDVPSDVSTVSGNAQRRDKVNDELTVRILADGDVKAESSTSAEYGVAQVSHSF